MELVLLTNKNNEKFEVEPKVIDNVLSAEFVIKTPFKEFEGTPDEYIAKAKEIIGEPKFPEIGKEGIVLGWLLFNGVREYGIEYLKRILEEEDAINSIVYMLVAQAEALSSDVNEGMEESESIITEEGKDNG